MADDTPTNPPETLADELENAVEQGGTPEPETVEPTTLSDEVHNAQQQAGTPTPSRAARGPAPPRPGAPPPPPPRVGRRFSEGRVPVFVQRVTADAPAYTANQRS